MDKSLLWMLTYYYGREVNHLCWAHKSVLVGGAGCQLIVPGIGKVEFFFGRQLIPRKPRFLLVENDYLHSAENSPKWEPLLSSVELVKLIHWQ